MIHAKRVRKQETDRQSAAELLLRDGKPYVAWGSIPCDSRMARILGRDSDVVAIVRLTKLGQSDGSFVLEDYGLVKPLKGKAPQLTDIYQSKELALRTCRVVHCKSELKAFRSLAKWLAVPLQSRAAPS